MFWIVYGPIHAGVNFFDRPRLTVSSCSSTWSPILKDLSAVFLSYCVFDLSLLVPIVSRAMLFVDRSLSRNSSAYWS